jgi:hypothetical protein
LSSVDPKTRAIAVALKLIAGEVGVIEASRELSGLRHAITGPSQEYLFQFVGIDSETDHLPLGPVREHWEPGALARKDLEIASYEESYRQAAVEAAEGLIERLRNSPW